MTYLHAYPFYTQGPPPTSFSAYGTLNKSHRSATAYSGRQRIDAEDRVGQQRTVAQEVAESSGRLRIIADGGLKIFFIFFEKSCTLVSDTVRKIAEGCGQENCVRVNRALGINKICLMVSET